MQNSAEQMRLFMGLTEAPNYVGPRDGDSDVTYSAKETKGQITQVIANLSSHESAKYTKLGRNLKRIEWLSEKVSQLKEQVKQETREKIADLFHAEDACRTRVIETVSFTLKMTKDPEASTSIKYAKVLEELQEHLTPELLAIMEGLKNKYSTVVEKEPALIKMQDKKATTEESFDAMLDEGILDTLRQFFHKYLQKVLDWGRKYDAKLEQLKAAAATNEAVEEAAAAMSSDEYYEIVEQLADAAYALGKLEATGQYDSALADRIQTAKEALFNRLSQ